MGILLLSQPCCVNIDVNAIQLQQFNSASHMQNQPGPLPNVSTNAIELRDLTLGYERHPAVHHLSLTLQPGSLVALVGPNGAGKSTLIKALAGSLRPIGGQLLRPADQRIAWLPQHSGLDPSFPIDVRGMVTLGLWHQVGALGRIEARHRAQCDAALAAVGLTGFEARPLDTLSGGQLQRALFARLILQDAPLVLLDEPFAAVDNRTSADLLALLHRWQRQGKTVIVVLHDLAQVRAHFPLTLLLARELVAFGPTAEALTEANWARAQHMREPFDEAAPPCETTPATHAHAHNHSHTVGEAHP
jgi:zinc/manganese transport system ATP-binding protein